MSKGPWKIVQPAYKVGWMVVDIGSGNKKRFFNTRAEARKELRRLRAEAVALELLDVVVRLMSSAESWSEYYVPIGIVEDMRTVIKKATKGE